MEARYLSLENGHFWRQLGRSVPITSPNMHTINKKTIAIRNGKLQTAEKQIV